MRLFYISHNLIILLDVATICLRQEAVTELIENEELFYNLHTIIGRFLDTEHLLSMCVQIPKQENVRTAEAKINNIIYLKHVLELLGPFHDFLQESKCSLLREYAKVITHYYCNKNVSFS